MTRSARVTEILTELTLEEKCLMLSGRTAWTLPGCERLGVPEWTVSDGPVGVRGRAAGPGLVTPGPSALGATWNPDLVAEIGVALGTECRDKNVDALLAPTVNLHRSPRGGRHFESYSEEPQLSSAIGAAYIRGVQSVGVGACVKHYVANDQETDRFTIDVRVDERTLREIYLPPFEAAVEADVRMVMGAYNYVNGIQACAHDELLNGLLKDEWGFDGVVISDWYAIKETVAPARGGLDLEMPGPGRWWGNGRLVDAVRSGEVDEAAIDDKVARVLGFLDWRGRLTGDTVHDESPRERPEHRELVRLAAVESTVLIRNEGGILPLDPAATVAVIGPGARHTALLGGGSAQLLPYRTTSVLDAFTERLGDTRVTHAVGVDLRRGAPRIPKEWIEGGVVAELHDGDTFDDEPFDTVSLPGTLGLWIGDTFPVGRDSMSIRMRVTVRPPISGDHLVMAAGNGIARALLDGVEVASSETGRFPTGLGMQGATATCHLEAGRAYDLVLEHRPENPGPIAIVELGVGPVPERAGALDEAAQVAAEADVAVVVVGSTSEWESEGVDRDSMDLPAGQDELVRRVVAANPATVVVLNCGAPMTLPWLDDVPGVLLAWYPGQEGGEAIADVLLGDADPGGRMPTTWAVHERDTPAYGNFPGEGGVVRYDESIFVGYRWYDTHGIEPPIPFGHGGSYTTFAWGAPEVTGLGTDLEITVPVTNTGDRSGAEVVQLYVAPPESPVDRPVKVLAAFGKVHVAPGETATATLRLDRRSFARWDPDVHDWVVDPGRHRLLVAASAVDTRSELHVDVPG